MSGPDFRLLASFAPANAHDLARAVRRFAFQHFAHYAMDMQYCQQHNRTCSYDMYIDTNNYQQFVHTHEGHQPSNLWIYHQIEVCGTVLLIERGYGGYGTPYAAEEQALLRWLLGMPHLALQSWKVMAGGDGYPYTEEASGASAAALLAYLDANQ